jgi:hypothetical protein
MLCCVVLLTNAEIDSYYYILLLYVTVLHDLCIICDLFCIPGLCSHMWIFEMNECYQLDTRANRQANLCNTTATMYSHISTTLFLISLKLGECTSLT